MLSNNQLKIRSRGDARKGEKKTASSGTMKSSSGLEKPSETNPNWRQRRLGDTFLAKPVVANRPGRHMIFSASTEYAIRALTYLAHHGSNGPVGAQEISRADGIPQQFLSKILHALTTKGIISSVRGPGGGFRLARRAEEIKLGEIVRVFESIDIWDRACVLGLDVCDAKNPCALHNQWNRFKHNGLKKSMEFSLRKLEQMEYRKRARR